MGAFADASGAATVTDARSKVGFPHEGQNFFELSLHILKWILGTAVKDRELLT